MGVLDGSGGWWMRVLDERTSKIYTESCSLFSNGNNKKVGDSIKRASIYEAS
jgi:hypothetical protein